MYISVIKCLELFYSETLQHMMKWIEIEAY